MLYQCDRCRAALPGGATICASCGRRFDTPVPIETETQKTELGMEALLRARTVNGERAQGTAQPESNSPIWYKTQTRPRPDRRIALGVSVGTSIIIVLVLIGWAGSVLWSRGLGGEQAFRQHNQAGNLALEHGDFQKASDEYGQMIALRPHRPDGYALRAMSENKAGQDILSIRDNTAALALTNEPMTRGDLLYNRAESYVNCGDLDQAITDYTQSIHEYASAHGHWDQDLVEDRQAAGLRGRAAVYWQRKDYPHTVADYSAVITYPHQRPTDYGLRAQAEAAQGLDTAAGADFNHALKLDPSYLAGYAGLGGLAEKRHQFGEGIAVFKRETQAEPGNAQSWGGLGWFQYEAGHYPQAIATDQYALSLDPRQSWILFNLALCYAASGESAHASAAYAQALANGSKADQKSALTDLRNARARQPGLAVLRAAEQQVSSGIPGGGAASIAAAPSRTLRSHSPFAKFLGPEITMNGYAIQPPAGYSLTQTPHDTLNSTGTLYLWSGPLRDDGTRPTLQIIISKDDGTLAAHETSAEGTQKVLDSMSDNHSQLTISPVTMSTFGGVAYGHGDWQGIGQHTGKTYVGSEYFSVTPAQIIHLSSHDASPYDQDTSPLLQASILTFRKL